jgi:hypothetical protein
MLPDATNPEGGASGSGKKCSLLAGVNTPEFKSSQSSKQEEKRLSAGAYEALFSTSREEIGMLLSEIAARAETGLLYVGLADERGLRYAVNNIVNLSVCVGDEALQLRRLRSEARAADAERLSVLRQGEASQ